MHTRPTPPPHTHLNLMVSSLTSLGKYKHLSRDFLPICLPIYLPPGFPTCFDGCGAPAPVPSRIVIHSDSVFSRDLLWQVLLVLLNYQRTRPSFPSGRKYVVPYLPALFHSSISHGSQEVGATKCPSTGE